MAKGWTCFFRSENIKEDLRQYFRMRLRFLKRRQSIEAPYPYQTIDPFDVFGEDADRCGFTLVGDNWGDVANPKPIAILFGFNNWKWGFMADYLADYRIAVAPRKIFSLVALFHVRRFPARISTFFFWGFNEPWTIRLFARFCRKRKFRVEDGFVRSAELGAAHTTPYSLVIDQRGLYYDPRNASGVERLLNRYSFTPEDISDAASCLQSLNTLRISKYNPASIRSSSPSDISLKRKIAVIGQVDNDMSIRLGNPDKWSSADMVRLANFENPDAEIFYRAHPEIYKGFQKSRFRFKHLKKICTLASPDVPLIDFLDSVDHVYTITSLSGLEALLRGKSVTVLGSAFYAGWGLTDDRAEIKRRKRKLTLEQLVCGIYLKYPRYLANINSSTEGLFASCLKIKADLQINEHDLYTLNSTENDVSFKAVLHSPYWPKIVFKKRIGPNDDLVGNALRALPYDNIFVERSGDFFKLILAYSLCGACRSDAERNAVLSGIANHLDSLSANDLLLDMCRVYPGEYIQTQVAALISDSGESHVSALLLEEHSSKLAKLRQAAIVAAASAQRKGGGEQPIDEKPVNYHLLSFDQADLLLQALEYSFQNRDFDRCIALAKTLLLQGYYSSRIFVRMRAISGLRFMHDSERSFARLMAGKELYQQNGTVVIQEASAHTTSDIEARPLDFLVLLVKSITVKPDSILKALSLLNKFDFIYDEELTGRLLISTLELSSRPTIEKAMAYVAVEKPKSSMRVMERLAAADDGSDEFRVAYSQALSYDGQLGAAVRLMNKALSVSKSSKNYRERLRLCVLEGDYDTGLKVLREAQNRRVDLGDMHPRKIYFGSRMVTEALETFCNFALRNTFATYFKEKYLHDIDDLTERDELLLITIFGPGDEIRFASIYKLLRNMFNCRLSISCEPRLLPLFIRSFQGITFVPTPRPRVDYVVLDQDRYSQLPGADLATIIDNTAMDAIGHSTHVAFVTDMLHRVLKGYNHFPGVDYLVADAARVSAYKARLQTNKLLVGISWRSSLTTHSRNEHYLTIEELASVFKIEGIQFVNFQYDECSAELAWVEKRYPGKLLNLSDIDHYNDFDSVAALMCCMDLVVAPATTVVELAGALGCPTLMLSNSSELHWRKIDAAGTDVWHHSIRHIEAENLGSKEQLVAAVTDQLNRYVKSGSCRPL